MDYIHFLKHQVFVHCFETIIVQQVLIKHGIIIFLNHFSYKIYDTVKYCLFRIFFSFLKQLHRAVRNN